MYKIKLFIFILFFLFLSSDSARNEIVKQIVFAMNILLQCGYVLSIELEW